VIWQLKKDGYSDSTIEPIGKRLRNLAKRVDLDNPSHVKDFIARAELSEGYKENLINAYNHYAVFHRLSWNRPQYQRASSIHKLPPETDIDLVISYTKTRNRVAFRLVKECGLRPIEVSRLMLKHVDLGEGLVYPETAKDGEARVLKLKTETLALLKLLVSKRNVKVDEKIFPCSKTLQKNWNKLRNRIVERLGKPELKQIRLYDLRHFYGTNLYRKTKDIVYVQRKLGHKNIKNTLVYINLVDFQDQEFTVKATTSVKEATELLEQGFEYVTEIDGLKLFRKPK
jgi:integrase